MPRLPIETANYGVRRRLGVAFRRNKRLQAHDEVVAALRQGYQVEQSIRSLVATKLSVHQALNTLDNTVAGDNDARYSFVSQLNCTVTIVGKQSTVPSTRGRKKSQNGIASRSAGSEGGEPEFEIVSKSILDRPYKRVSGRRTIPRLISANGIPFLRYKKPQPRSLSRYLNDRAVQHQRNTDRCHEYERQVQIAKLEDAWDRKVDHYCRLNEWEELRRTWNEAPTNALNDLINRMKWRARSNKKMAMNMYHVMEEERRLAEQEKKERRDEKHQRYKARRLVCRPSERTESKGTVRHQVAMAA